jgi:ABC-2 type transport system permease protein
MEVLLIARKEFKQVWLDGRFRWIMGLLLILFVLAAWAGFSQQQDYRSQYNLAMHEQRELWVNKGEMNPHSAAHHGMHIFKPASLVAALDQGLQAYLGVSLFLEAHKQNQTRYRGAEDGTTLQRFAVMNAATVAEVMVPLMIILVSFGAFAAERESGTLRQLLSLGLRTESLWLGKMLGLTASLLVLLLPLSLLGLLALRISGGSEAFASGAPRLLTWMGVHALYWLYFLWGGLLISARSKTARFALMLLLAFWFLNSFVGPRLGMLAAALWHRAPTAVELQAAIEADSAKIIDWDTRTQKIESSLLKKYKVKAVKDLPVNPAGLILADAERDDARVYQTHLDHLEKDWQKQVNIFSAMGALLPGMAVQNLSMGLAGSDWQHHQHFTQAAEIYRLAFVQRLNTDVSRKTQAVDAYEYTAGKKLWEEIEDFHYDLPHLNWVMQSQRNSLLILLGWGLFLGLITPLALRRIPVD